MNYFVTGTDTGVGKTLISVALLHAVSARGDRVAGFKPVAAGCDAQGMNEDVLALQAASAPELATEQINPYKFSPAIAPHLAAEQAGITINLAHILERYRALKAQVDSIIVEGVGGFEVPLNRTETTADLARELALPVILVVGMRLGCLNHALLTWRAIVDSGLECAGWVANTLDPQMPFLEDNISSLYDRLGVPLLAVVPYQPVPAERVGAVCLNLKMLEGKRP